MSTDKRFTTRTTRAAATHDKFCLTNIPSLQSCSGTADMFIPSPPPESMKNFDKELFTDANYNGMTCDELRELGDLTRPQNELDKFTAANKRTQQYVEKSNRVHQKMQALAAKFGANLKIPEDNY